MTLLVGGRRALCLLHGLLLYREEIGKLLILQLPDRLLQHLLVGLVPEVGDEAGLLRAEEVSCAPYVEVLHRYLDTAPQLGKGDDALEPTLRRISQCICRGRQEDAVRLPIPTPYPTAELVEVAETEALRLIDDDGIGIGYIDPILHHGGGEEDVVLLIDKASKHLLQLLRRHLTVADTYADARHRLPDILLHALHGSDPVIDHKDLPITRQLSIDRIGEHLRAVGGVVGPHGVTIGRRGKDIGEVAGAHEGKLERPRDRRGSHRQRVHLGAHLPDLLLHRDAKLLLLIDDQQPQVLKFHPLPRQRVGADQYVDLPLRKILQQLRPLFPLPCRIEVIDPHGEVLEPFLEGVVVLVGKHGRRHHHRHLLAICARLKCRPHGDLRLAESDIPTDQAVHRHRRLHIRLHLLRSLLLIGRILVHKGGLQLLLQVGVGAKGEALHLQPLGVELDQVAGDLLDLLLRLILQPIPGAAAQLIELRSLLHVLALVLGDAAEGVDADVEAVTALKVEPHRLPFLPILLDLTEPAKLCHPVVGVDDVVPVLKSPDVLQRQRRAPLADAVTLEPIAVVPLEDRVVRQQAELDLVVDEAPVQRRSQWDEVDRLLPLGEEPMESPQLALLVTHDHRRKGLMLVVGERLGEEVHFLMKEGLRLLAEGDLPPLRLLPQVDAPGEEREVLQLRHHRLRLDQPRLHLLEGVEDIVLRVDRGHLVDRAEGGGEEGVARQVDHRLRRQ